MASKDESRRQVDEFATLKPKTIYLSQRAIRKRYRRLTYLQHAASRELLQDVEHRSKGRSGRMKTNADSDACVNEVTKRLVEQLPRMPFPPKTDETHFDHEANVRRIGRLEEQMNSTTHATTLLRAQIIRERALLEQDRAETESLDKSLRSNQAYRRDQLKMLHPMARQLGRKEEIPDLLDVSDKSTAVLEPDLNALQDSDEISDLLKDLNDHVTSIEINTLSVAHVSRSLKEALQTIEQCAFD